MDLVDCSQYGKSIDVHDNRTSDLGCAVVEK